MIEKDDNFCYKGIYYCLKDNVWYLFDDWERGYLFSFNSDVYRLDECFKYIQNKAVEWSISELNVSGLSKTKLEKEFINKFIKK